MCLSFLTKVLTQCLFQNHWLLVSRASEVRCEKSTERIVAATECRTLNPFLNKHCFFKCLQCKSFENIVGKGEIARNEQFLLFSQCFLPFFMNFPPFLSNSKLLSATSFSLEESKICCLGKG